MLPLNKGFEKLTPEGAYLVLNRATELERQGRDIIHLEIGQPDFPTPKNISLAAISAIEGGMTKYVSPLGILPLRRKIAQIHRVSENQVAITPSGKTAIFAAMAATLNRGDEVVFPDPGFPTYRALIDYFGCIPKAKVSSKTKLIILNSPSNPTGNIIKENDLNFIRDLSKEVGCFVLTDEMYSKIVYTNYTSYYSISDEEKTILVNGFSKTYSMTGWRIGYVVFPEYMKEKMDSFLTHTIGCTATFTQMAALEALSGKQSSVKLMVSEFKKRRDYIVKALDDIPGVVCDKPDGAFYVFPDISFFGKSSEYIAKYLLDEGVALLPGSAFGSGGEGFLRISYATSMEKLMEGIRRIKIALEKL